MNRPITPFLDRPAPAAFLAALILASTVAFSLETLPGLPAEVLQALRVFEIVVVVIFTAEYAVRIITSKQKLRFIFSLYGLVDLIAILPFYLALAVDLRSLRMVRLIRLVRLFKLARYAAAAQRLVWALREARDELVVSLGALALVLYFAAFGLYHFEHAAQPEKVASIFDAGWMALATLSTVGFGDMVPITVGGRIFTFFILIIGLGLVAVPTGIFASSLLAIRNRPPSEQPAHVRDHSSSDPGNENGS